MTTLTAQQAGNQQDFVQEAISKFSAEAKSLLAQQHKDLKTANEDALAKTNARLNEVGEKLAAAQAESKRLADIIADIETAPRKKSNHGHEKAPVTKSLGHRVTRSLDFAQGVKNAQRLGANGKPSPIMVNVGSIWGKTRNAPADMIDQIIKAGLEGKTVDFDDDSVGTGVNPQYIPGLVEFPKLMPMIRLLVPAMATTETNLIKLDREKQELPLVARVTAVSNIGDTTINVDNVTGFSTSTGWATVYLDNGSDPVETNTVTTITADSSGDGSGVLTVTATGIALAVGDRVYAQRFGVTPEGDLAPRSLDEYEDYEVAVAELSTFVRANAVKLSDITYLEQFIERRLLNRIARMEDLHCFYGPGGTGKIKGIFADTAVAESTRTGGTYQDHIIGGIYSVWGRYYQPMDVVVALSIHQALTTAKDSTGRYLFWSDQQAGTPMQMHVARLHGHNQLSATHGVVGDFGMACTIFDREDAQVEIGYNNDDMQRRKKTILAYERLAFAIEQPNALQRLVF